MLFVPSLTDNDDNTVTMDDDSLPMFVYNENQLPIDSVWFSDDLDSLYWRTNPSSASTNNATGSSVYHFAAYVRPVHKELIGGEYWSLAIMLSDSVDGDGINGAVSPNMLSGDTVFIQVNYNGLWGNNNSYSGEVFQRSTGYAIWGL